MLLTPSSLAICRRINARQATLHGPPSSVELNRERNAQSAGTRCLHEIPYGSGGQAGEASGYK
jgi:hypothetical protein